MQGPAKRRRTCPAGHHYFKTSDCPVCPVCEQDSKPEDGFLSLLGAPARRALEAKGIVTIRQLTLYREKDLLAWHGLGPATIPLLRQVLAAAGLSFKSNEE